MRRIFLAVLCLAVATAHAATFTVTSTNNSGAGSLRDAIAQANAAPGADTIAFAVTGTIVLTSGALSIEQALTIVGPGADNLTIDGNANDRIFTIIEPAAPACPALTGPSDYLVSISGLTLANAHRNSNNSGGAIFSVKSLALDSVTVRDNQAKGGAGLSYLVQHPGQSLTILNSRFLNNIAKPLSVVTDNNNAGAGLRITENCPVRTTPVTVAIANSLFSGNRTQPTALWGLGGAITTFSDADITITGTRIVDNGVDPPNPPVAGANYFGGGVYGRAKSLTIERSEISGNVAVRGGGLRFYNDLPDLQTPLTAMQLKIVNSTITNNSGTQSAGALETYGNIAVEISNSTLSHNNAAVNRTGGIVISTGATSPPSASNALTGTLKLASSIVANSNSTTVDVATNVATIPTFTIDSTNSLIESICATCGTISVAGTGNLVGVDPQLGPLAANGGTTLTRAPYLGSPVIGAGSNPLVLTTDQRGAGFPRTQGSATDMGALEYVYPANCDTFTDVPGNSPFCANVAWLKNRAITTGCTSTTAYCPADAVSRLAMAAFMNRLGTALTGARLAVQAASGALDVDTDPIVCITGDFTATGAPRRARVDAVFSATAAGDVGMALVPAVSYDAGATWQDVVGNPDQAHVKAGRWHNFRTFADLDVVAGQTLRFGLHIDRAGSTGGAQLTDSRCNLLVRMGNSNGVSSP